MRQQEPFKVTVSFSGLIVYVRRSGVITHALLQEARHNHSLPPHGNCHTWIKSDMEHKPEFWICGPDFLPSTDWELLDRKLLSFRWLDSVGNVIAGGTGATPWPGAVGDLPNNLDRDAFAWVPDLTALTGGATVNPACVEQPGQGVHSGVAAQVALEGGDIRTAEFAHAQEFLGGRKTNWLPRLTFAYNKHAILKRASAEMTCWVVEPPKGPPDAKTLEIVLTDLDSGIPAVFRRTPVALGAWVGLDVRNSPPQRCQGSNEIHIGRQAGQAGLHFGMTEALLQPAGTQVPRPWIPASFRPNPPDANALPPAGIQPNRCETCGDSEKRLGLLGDEEGYEYISQALAHRPLCIPGVADG